MDIIKNLKDYKLSIRQRIFAGYLSDKINSYTCSEEIKNKNFIRGYFSPDKDFIVYATAIDDLATLRQIRKPHYDDEREVG